MNAPQRVEQRHESARAASAAPRAWRGLVLGGLDLRIATERPLPATGYAGAALRGLLGHALARAVCHLPQPACAGCARQGGCAYARAFKPATLPGAAAAMLPGYLPHRWRLRAGRHELHLRLHLFGPGLAYAATIAQALASAAPDLDWAGGGSGRVLALCDAASGAPFGGPHARLAPLPWPVLPAAAALRVRLTTPLATKHAGADPLWPALRTRLQRLVKLYGDASTLAPDPVPPWRLESARLHPETLARGGPHERLARGWRGELDLSDLTPPGRELLAAGLLLHAGADTTLGFGRYEFAEATADHTAAPNPTDPA